MDGLKVSELARRSGVPASTVRYYEHEGLLPARRSSSGYRLYDQAAVDRLEFIGTAKSLGLPLPEIRRLLEPWQHGMCSDVQAELGPLLERRIAETYQRIEELGGFADRLERARAQLATIERDGPCDPSCAFLGREETVAGPTLTALPVAAEVSAEVSADVIACTLDGHDRGTRADQWRAVLAHVDARRATSGGIRLTFAANAPMGELAELCAAEAGCCSFFAFTLTIGPPVQLDVRAPGEALVLVQELFGEPDT